LTIVGIALSNKGIDHSRHSIDEQTSCYQYCLLVTHNTDNSKLDIASVVL
jgi:hypothetical protein